MNNNPYRDPRIADETLLEQQARDWYEVVPDKEFAAIRRATTTHPDPAPSEDDVVTLNMSREDMQGLRDFVKRAEWGRSIPAARFLDSVKIALAAPANYVVITPFESERTPIRRDAPKDALEPRAIRLTALARGVMAAFPELDALRVAVKASEVFQTLEKSGYTISNSSPSAPADSLERAISECEERRWFPTIHRANHNTWRVTANFRDPRSRAVTGRTPLAALREAMRGAADQNHEEDDQ